MTKLSRNDIVGQSIVDVRQTEWDRDDDGFAACAVYVQLSNNVVFELRCQDPFEELPIPLVNLGFMETLLPIAKQYQQLTLGETICEVLTSNYWPTFGLLLSNNQFFFGSDEQTPREVGPCVMTVGDFYKIEDVATYWGHQPVT